MFSVPIWDPWSRSSKCLASEIGGLSGLRIDHTHTSCNVLIARPPVPFASPTTRGHVATSRRFKSPLARQDNPADQLATRGMKMSIGLQVVHVIKVLHRRLQMTGESRVERGFKASQAKDTAPLVI